MWGPGVFADTANQESFFGNPAIRQFGTLLAPYINVCRWSMTMNPALLKADIQRFVLKCSQRVITYVLFSKSLLQREGYLFNPFILSFRFFETKLMNLCHVCTAGSPE